MDILLINPYAEDSLGVNTTVEVPVGILCLASFLESKGKKVGLIDAAATKMPLEKILEVVKEETPKFVGISVNIFSYIQAIDYTKAIKNISKDIKVVWGGPYPTVATDICFRNSKVDFIVIGEGELTLFETLGLVSGEIDVHDIKGLAYRLGDGYEINPPRERIADLDVLPLPAYHLLPDLKYYRTRARKLPFMGIITSRGCPYNCTYCSKDVFKNKITVRSPAHIIKEIDLLVKKYRVKQLDILDDNFSFNKTRVHQLCDLIISGNYKLCINLQSGVRADRVDESLIKKMKKAGVFKLAFGVETGNCSIMKTIKKQLDLNKVLEASRLARKYDMVINGFFMIGLPGENEKTLQETIDFAIKMNPHIATFSMTIPFYGTELYKQIEKEGKFVFDTKEGVRYGFYATEGYYELGTLTPELMVKYYKKAYKDFYYRFSKVMDFLLSIRSWNEFLWTAKAVLTTMIFFGKKNRQVMRQSI